MNICSIQCNLHPRSIGVSRKSITKFVNAASREFPIFVAQVLCSASLTALLKKNVEVRTIVVGEVPRRLIAKFLVTETESEAAEWFGMFQLGVWVSRGAEVIIHTHNSYANKQITCEKTLCSELPLGNL